MAVKNTKDPVKQVWFNISEAAEYIGVSHDTLRRWEKKGKLVPRRTVGKHRRYSKKQLENVLKRPLDTIPQPIQTVTKQIVTEQIPSSEPQITKIVTPETSQYSPTQATPAITTQPPPQPQISTDATSQSTLSIPQITTQIPPQPNKTNIIERLKNSFSDTVSLIILVVIFVLLLVSFFLLRSANQSKTNTTLSPIPSYNEVQ